MIERQAILPLLLAACPSYRERWERYVESNYSAPDDSEPLIYCELGDFGTHLVGLIERGETKEFASVFTVIERLLNEGDEWSKEAVAIGLLEDIQNVALNSKVDLERFEPFLGEETKEWWNKIIAFWNGNPTWLERQIRKVGALWQKKESG